MQPNIAMKFAVYVAWILCMAVRV